MSAKEPHPFRASDEPREAIPYCVVIPAYRPSTALLEALRELMARGVPAVVVVDDGSGPEYQTLFDGAAEFPRVSVVRHAVNLGKGAALKAGINFALCAFPEIRGVVTADADGQHDPADIERVGAALVAQPEALILGCRAFGGDVPLRSRFGNLLTRGVMHALLGRAISDTQTGLRGIPAGLLPRILRLESTGYEFELEMLLAAHRFGVRVVEQPIRTIYEQGNASSHFNPLVDSAKIYFILLRYVSVSVLTALIDNLVFYVAFHRSGHVLASQVLGRACALAFNYAMLRGSVFNSRQGHRQVLPKYLGLVLASGSASYAGIRLLGAYAGMTPVAAKILVETILFFGNFAVARLFIFHTRGEDPEGPVQAAPEPGYSQWGPTSWLAIGLLAGSVWLLVANFLDGRLLAQHIWDTEGLPRLAVFSAAYLAVAAPLLAFLPRAFPAAILAAFCGLSMLALGPLPVLASAFFLFSACCLGWTMLGRSGRETASAHVCATLLGIAVYSFLMHLVARAPVNYPAAWAALLAIPIVIDWRRAGRRLADWGGALGSIRLRPKATRFFLALLVFLLGMHWYAVLTPENADDALATHLAIPANIAAHHAMTFEPSRFVWAVTPMGADFTYSIAYLLGGEAASRLINFAMFFAIAALVYYAARRWLPAWAGLLLAAAFVSTPLAQLVTGSLFVENLQAALILGGLACLWHFSDTGERRFFLAAAALAGSALSIKIGSLAYEAAVAPLAVWEARRRWKSLGARASATCWLAGALFVAAAAPPYVIAWVKTADPLFPFFSQTFPSPLLPAGVRLEDVRYSQPLSWRALPDLTFHSSLYYEGQDGSFGFQYLLLFPLALGALLAIRKRPAAGGAAAVALAGAIVILIAQPNARYLYPALPLATVASGAALGWLGRNRWVFRGLVGYVFVCTALNAYFLPSSGFYHKDFGMSRPFSQKDREVYMQDAAPIRAAVSYMNGAHPDSAVLFTSDSGIADFQGDVYENHWHQVNTLEQIRKAHGRDDLLRLLAGWKVRYFIARKPDAGGPTYPETLARLLETCTIPEFQWNYIYVARLKRDCDGQSSAEPAAASSEEPVPPGLYDDTNAGVIYRGRWTHDRTWAEPAYSHTVSFSVISGDEASLSFNGSSVTYVFTRAFNRGIGEVLIDGASRGTVDLYDAKIVWRSQTKYEELAPGRHTIAIRVTGRKHPASQGYFVDLDAFIVK